MIGIARFTLFSWLWLAVGGANLLWEKNTAGWLVLIWCERKALLLVASRTERNIFRWSEPVVRVTHTYEFSRKHCCCVYVCAKQHSWSSLGQRDCRGPTIKWSENWKGNDVGGWIHAGSLSCSYLHCGGSTTSVHHTNSWTRGWMDSTVIQCFFCRPLEQDFFSRF